MFLAELLAEGTEQLSGAGIVSARVDAEILIAHVLHISRGELLAKIFSNSDVSEVDVRKVKELLQKRGERIPLQHITGVAHFRNLSLSVGPGVFIPRPETEIVAELAIDALKRVSGRAIAVDLCTGSGAIALSMASEVPTSKVYAWELNPDTELWLRKNVASAPVEIELVMGDIQIDHELFFQLAGSVDVVVSNPPYIPDEAIPRDLEVKLHDPTMALYGGKDGMDVMRQVSARALQLLRPGGLLVVEHADNQGRIVADLFEGDGWDQIRNHQDLNMRDRAVTAVKAL